MQHVPVAEQTEVDAPVVAHDRDAEPLPGGERHHRKDVPHLPPLEVERELRPGHVRHHHVEEALAGEQPRRLAHDRRGREPGEVGEDLSSNRLATPLELEHVVAHLLVAVDRVLAGDGQRRPLAAGQDQATAAAGHPR